MTAKSLHIQQENTIADAAKMSAGISNVGYDEEEKSWRVIAKYYGDIKRIEEQIEGIKVTELFNQYAVVQVPESQLEKLISLDEIIYVEKPREVYFNLDAGRGVSCINSIQGQPGNSFVNNTGQSAGLNLTGRGVLVGIIDSGIDYSHPAFLNEDGTTRIRYIWDQTASGESTYGRVPAGYNEGAEYSADDINEALRQTDKTEQLKIVPVSDRGTGHGTAVAGVAAGNGAGSQGRRYRGVAVSSELIVVKLGKSGSSFALSTEVIEAIDYAVRKAIELNMPIAINLSFGNNEGPHDGNSLFENYIADMKGIWKNVIVVASGNEGDARHHANVKLENAGDNKQIQIAIAENERNVSLQIWKSYQDEFKVYIISPDERRLKIDDRLGSAETYFLGNSKINTLYGEPTPYTITQGIYIQWLPDSERIGRNYIMPGVWIIELEPVDIQYGEVNMWLPSTEVVGLSTGFLNPSSETTLTIPSAARNIITVGAYNSITGSYAPFSGRGNTTDGRKMPTIVAPGVDITSTAPGGRYSSNTGTSIAAPFVTGSAALIMEWGIVRGNDVYLYGDKLKAYLIKGARELPGQQTGHSIQYGWGALCVANSLP